MNKRMPLILRVPLAGWSAPLEEVPDPVFAGQMLGDGVAIDPTDSVLHAPCDAEVIALATTQHAVTLRAANGAEILMHIGIDTVALAGEGFRALVKPGEHVARGQPLLELDLDLIARRAKSTITPIVITNGEHFRIARRMSGRSVEVGEALMEIEALAGADENAPAADASAITDSTIVMHEHGIHARPAALIARFAKAVAADITLGAHGRSANARSAVAMMSLGVRRGDAVTLSASGNGAAAALAGLKDLIAGLSDEPEPPQQRGSWVARTAPPSDHVLHGVIASRGLAIGRAVTLHAIEIQVQENGAGVAHERAELDRARAAVRARLTQLTQSSTGSAREVMSAHLEFLDDPQLLSAARRMIVAGKSAAFAWRHAVRDSVDILRSVGDPHLAERVDDLLDLESQVIVALSGPTTTVAHDLPEQSMLIAADLKPSQFIALDACKLAGMCLAGGGPTSHVAILAANAGVPMLVALGPAVIGIQDGSTLVLDAEQGTLNVRPDGAELAAARQRVAARQQRRRHERAAAHTDCRTADGERIEVFVNMSSASDAPTALAHGAEGCGLLRTEFLFLERHAPPDEEEQLQQYQAIASALAGKPLVIRTLDMGGDKPIPYLPLPPEANPALGLRGVRTSLWRPDLLRTQLQAILRVQPVSQCRILLPMITDAAEITSVRHLLEETQRELGIAAHVAVGAMIETPASALNAGHIAAEIDFLSIGTNDLTQYTLAMDRGHQELAHRIDGLHPAVLRLIAMTTAAAERHGRPTAVCGGLASDPLALPLLIGLGVRELSVIPTLVPQIKARIRTLTLERCRALAQQSLALDTVDAVHALLNASSDTDTPVTS